MISHCFNVELPYRRTLRSFRQHSIRNYTQQTFGRVLWKGNWAHKAKSLSWNGNTDTLDRGPGRFSGGVCLWWAKIMWPNPSAVEHVKCAKRYSEMSRVLALFVWPVSIDWPERKCEKIFSHTKRKTPPEKLPVLQTFPVHDQVHPWYLSWNRGVPMASRRGQILLAVFYSMRVLPMRLATVSTQGLCLVHSFDVT